MLVFFVILASYVGPSLKFIDAWRDSGAEKEQLRELQQENQQLKAKAATLDGPDAAERAARRLGMISDGERSYVIK